MDAAFFCARYELLQVARTGNEFASFAPYVPSINHLGAVAFQATLSDGRSSAFISEGNAAVEVTERAGDFVSSHPDVNDRGDLCCYCGTTAELSSEVLLLTGGKKEKIAGSGVGLGAIGPLGPTINEGGAVAFRADLVLGGSGLYLLEGGETKQVAEAGEVFSGFEGLPVVDEAGRVVFRADLPDGRKGVYRWDGAYEALIETGGEFSDLGRFPSEDAGLVAIVATYTNGRSGAMLASGGQLACAVDSTSGFESLRGCLTARGKVAAFYATPVGGELGIYVGPDPVRDRLAGIGERLFDSTVTDFALNPVSVNTRGQFVFRATLSDGSEHIVRADPM